jgi:outer membrane protein assembly factor BamE (lipoprotein component of BamABCDE complex)
MRLFAAALLAGLVAAPALAQGTPPVSIDSGMTKAQVVERLGAPGIERTRGTFTFLFYSNGRERSVGMNDLVVLNDDKVVDAIFRSAQRTYTGRSTSPRAIPPAEARKANPSGVMRVDTTQASGRLRQ